MAETKPRRITIPEFLEQMPSPQVRQAAQRLMAVAEENGGLVKPGHTGISLRYPAAPAWPHPISVAWLYPGERGWMKTRCFSFGKLKEGNGPESLPDEVRQALKSWFDSFADDADAVDVSTANVAAWAIKHEAAVRHIDQLATRLQQVMATLQTIHLEDVADCRMAYAVMERVRRGQERIYSTAEVMANLGLDG